MSSRFSVSIKVVQFCRLLNVTEIRFRLPPVAETAVTEVAGRFATRRRLRFVSSAPTPAIAEEKVMMWPRRRVIERSMKYVVLLLAVCILLFLYHMPATNHKLSSDANDDDEDQAAQHTTKFCSIPSLNPWDPSVRSYYEAVPPLRCKRLQPELTYLTTDGWLRVNESVVRSEQLSKVACRYRCFDRSEGFDDHTLKFTAWTDFSTNATLVRCGEFVEVTCTKGILPIPFYTNYHTQVMVLPRKQKANEKDTSDHGSSLTSDRRPPSIFLFILDSVSRSNFFRCFPKTLAILTGLYNATVFAGYNKVADNSFPNAMAFLAGKRVESSPGAKPEVPEDVGEEFFDDWPLIWKNFSSRGYVTVFAEDMPSLGLFSYGMKGFRNRPTDHYLRPFWIKVWKSFLHLRSTHLCIGNQPTHRFQLHYLKDFLMKYCGTSTFVLSWLTEITHDWLNQGQVADEDMAAFFEQIYPYLNNTITFVLADHGQRFSSIRQTVVGRLEENMPFFSVSLPRWVQQTYPNLKTVLDQNGQLLTTHFDLYATLLHICRRDSWESLAQETSFLASPTRFVSLFHRFSAVRTCEQAGVPIYYCICQQEDAVDVNSSLVKRAGSVVVQHLNHLLEQLNESCASLKLKAIRRASQLKPPVLSVRNKWWLMLYKSITNDRIASDQKHFIVQIEADPGDGQFEALLQYTKRNDSFSITHQISRINKYGNQSYCIRSAVLKKFCYCIVR